MNRGMQFGSSLKRYTGRLWTTNKGDSEVNSKVLNPMGFNARSNTSSQAKEEFVNWLLNETTQHFARSAGNQAGLKAAVFLSLGRGYEAGLTPDETGDALCDSLNAANLGDVDFEFTLQQ